MSPFHDESHIFGCKGGQGRTSGSIRQTGRELTWLLLGCVIGITVCYVLRWLAP